MSHRKKDTEKTLGCVLWILFTIPMAIIAIIRWAVAGLSNFDKQTALQSASMDLHDVDKMDGWSFEYYVAELLKKNGYSHVCVTNGSGDFGVDITAFKDNKKWAFQCKNYASKLGVSPIQEVYSGSPKYNAQVCVVVTNSYFTSHAQELAKSLNVILWDRVELAKLIQSRKELSEDVNSKQYDLDRGKTASDNKEIIIAQNLLPVLTQVVEQKMRNEQSILTEENKKKKQEDYTMATTLGAGKYIFGVDIPEGRYNLKAISGDGMLQIQKLIDGSWDEEWINFGVESYCARTYHGLSLPKNKYFEVTGNVIFEITKATMIEIE